MCVCVCFGWVMIISFLSFLFVQCVPFPISHCLFQFRLLHGNGNVAHIFHCTILKMNIVWPSFSLFRHSFVRCLHASMHYSIPIHYSQPMIFASFIAFHKLLKCTQHIDNSLWYCVCVCVRSVIDHMNFIFYYGVSMEDGMHIRCNCF